MPKFYGEKEIKDIKETGDVNFQELVFTDDTSIVLPKIMVVEAISDISLDPTKLRDKRCFPVVKNILEVMLKWDIHISEIDFIQQRVIMSINETTQKAENVLWKKDLQSIVMSDVNNVLMSAPKEEVIPSNESIPSPIHV